MIRVYINKTSIFFILLFLFSPLLAEQGQTTLYQNYISAYEKKGHKESDYFGQWIKIPVYKNLLASTSPNEETIMGLIKTESNNSEFIGSISNKSFQIHSYSKNDDAKYITYKADVIECYKGDCPKRILYKVSMEIDDSFYPAEGKEKIIFLERINNEFYNDPFLSFEASESTKSIFSRILKGSDARKGSSLDKRSRLLIETISLFYPNYNNKEKCWIVKSKEINENHYCLSITHSKVIETQSGKRRYLVLTSTMLDEKKDEFISHVTSGMAVLFIVSNSDSKLIAKSPTLLLGAYSTPPTSWKLIKLAPSDYWGWRTQVSDAHGGYFGGTHLIYAPYGKQGIKEIAGISAFYSNEGTGATGKKLTELDNKLSIIVDPSKRIYSLKAKLTGVKKGVKIKEKYWILSFDVKKWRYSEPDNWLLSGYEY